MISKSFIKASFIYTLAGSLPMASAVILLPFYIHYLSTDAYGALSLCLAFSVLIQIIVTYSFDTSIYIHYHELKAEPEKLSSFISSSFIFMLGLGLVVSLILMLLGGLVFTYVLPHSKISFYPYGFLSVFVGIFQALFKVHANILQIREKPETFFWANVFSFFVVASSTIVGLTLFPGTLIGPLGGRFLTGLISTLWVLIRIFKEFGIHVQSPWRYTSFSFNMYTFVYQLQQWTINYIDRFVILFFMPLSAVGMYDFAVKCLVGIDLIINGLNATINPKIVKLINIQTGRKGSTLDINRYFYGTVSTVMLIICLSIIGVPVIIDLFARKSGYAASLVYVPYLGVIYIFKSIRLYFVVPYSILKKMKRLTILNFFVAVVKIGLMAWFISVWQLYGVIFSALIAFSLEIVALWYYLKNDYEIKFNSFKLMIGPFILLLVILIFEPIFGARYALLVHTFYGLLSVAMLVLIYRNEVRALDPMKILR